MPKFTQPGIIVFEGKEYHHTTDGEDGDNVPMSKDLAEHHAVYANVLWWKEPEAPKDAAVAAAAAIGLGVDGRPLPVHPVTGVPAPLDTFPKTAPATAKVSVSPTVPTPAQ